MNRNYPFNIWGEAQNHQSMAMISNWASRNPGANNHYLYNVHNSRTFNQRQPATKRRKPPTICNQLKRRIRKMTRRQWFDILAVLVCMAGLLTQFGYVLRAYLHYYTTSRSGFDRKVVVDMPALSICFPFAIPPPLIETMFNKKICDLEQKEIFELQNKFFAIYRNAELPNKDMVVKIGDAFDCEIFVYEETNHTYSTKPCGDLTNSGVITSFAYQQGCFTLFSKLDGQHRNESLRFKSSGHVRLTVNVSKMYDGREPLLKLSPIISIHSQTIIPNLAEFSQKTLAVKKKYFVEFTKTTNLGMPPPYETNCKNYQISNEDLSKSCMDHWQSRSDCLASCVKLKQTCHRRVPLNRFDSVITAEDLIRFNSIYSNSTEKESVKEFEKLQNERIVKCVNAPLFLFRHCMFPFGRSRMCELGPDAVDCDSVETLMSRNFEQCLAQCPRDCVERLYDFIILDEAQPAQEGAIELMIYHKSVFDTVLEHYPDMTLEQFISDIGGLMGGWMGLSLIVLYRYFVTFAVSVFQHWKARR